ncbi:S-adenosyl-L-methionine-dependent methyltransferase [Mycena chlorophos]|uniref:S-adenosyl-L-methionine-dependent methyltransferase n=1 Tax=Mycena chlorophos TaxID=658473 RepID=A0A8H6RWX1_MYCCL|nr:S-adenosyl-L-methionine-dependent methyltransferase [Mycena chlorophos]
MPATALRELLAILSSSIDLLESTCDAAGVAVPDLHEPFTPPSEAFRAIPAAAEAASLIGAAALQIEAIVTPPPVTLYRIVGGNFRSAALRAVFESGVTELLREAGPQGMHVRDIGAANGQEPEKLARFLRALATHHVYREVAPNVFTNTRISSLIDTGNPSKEVLANPDKKHSGSTGMSAIAAHHLDEVFKAAAFAWETLDDPKTRHSGEPLDSPFCRSIGKPQDLWAHYKENKMRGERFGIAMQGMEKMQPQDAIVTAFPWSTLPKNAKIVDVGGGIGTSCFGLARHFPEFKLVVQDLPQVVKQAGEIWEEKFPGVVETGRVTLQEHDFFTTQPQKDASVFLVKQILHDWSDPYCVKILSQLWEAAAPDTTLLIMESLVPLACHDPELDAPSAIPGAAAKEAPAPLLANYGATNDMSYNIDMVMFFMFNSQERTFLHFQKLLASAGWEIVKVHRQAGDSTFVQSIEAKKVEKPSA